MSPNGKRAGMNVGQSTCNYRRAGVSSSDDEAGEFAGCRRSGRFVLRTVGGPGPGRRHRSSSADLVASFGAAPGLCATRACACTVGPCAFTTGSHALGSGTCSLSCPSSCGARAVASAYGLGASTRADDARTPTSDGGPFTGPDRECLGTFWTGASAPFSRSGSVAGPCGTSH
jgi:hypothetical protein